jgi:hypothetical protein
MGFLRVVGGFNKGFLRFLKGVARVSSSLKFQKFFGHLAESSSHLGNLAVMLQSPAVI